MNCDCAAGGIIANDEVIPGNEEKKYAWQSTSIVQTGAVVSVVGTETLSIMREPDVDDVVFGA
jgi:hypothetical protein